MALELFAPDIEVAIAVLTVRAGLRVIIGRPVISLRWKLFIDAQALTRVASSET